MNILVIKNANYYNIFLFMYQRGKWHKELKCPGTEGSVEMNILLQSQQDCKLSQPSWKTYWQYMLCVCQVILL